MPTLPYIASTGGGSHECLILSKPPEGQAAVAGLAQRLTAAARPLSWDGIASPGVSSSKPSACKIFRLHMDSGIAPLSMSPREFQVDPGTGKSALYNFTQSV